VKTCVAHIIEPYKVREDIFTASLTALYMMPVSPTRTVEISAPSAFPVFAHLTSHTTLAFRKAHWSGHLSQVRETVAHHALMTQPTTVRFELQTINFVGITTFLHIDGIAI